MLLPLPALGEPQDALAIDLRASALGFNVSQVGSIVRGRFPNWTGEVVRMSMRADKTNGAVRARWPTR